MIFVIHQTETGFLHLNLFYFQPLITCSKVIDLETGKMLMCWTRVLGVNERRVLRRDECAKIMKHPIREAFPMNE